MRSPSSKPSRNPEACCVTAFLNTGCPKRHWARRSTTSRNLGWRSRPAFEVGKDISLGDIQKDHQAVFIGVGAQGGMKLEAEGSDLPGVTDGIKFLQAVNLGEKVQVGKKVAVIGGGNTAIDCARTAKRLGAGGGEDCLPSLPCRNARFGRRDRGCGERRD